MDGISIIIPVFNEEESLSSFLQELHTYLQNLHLQWEVIVVDDGSTDNTPVILNSYSWIKIIKHPCRQGYGSAVKDGIRTAKYEYVCFMDGDSAHSPFLISKGLAAMNSLDLAIGARNEKGKDFPLSQKLARYLISEILTLTFRKKVKDINSGFRIVKREKILPYLKILPDGFSFSASLTLLALLENLRFGYFPIDINKRKGRSKLKNTTYVYQFLTCLYLTQFRWLKEKISSLE